jgi:hypothetical protein
VPRAPCDHEGSKVLLVEGSNDCHVIVALCTVHVVPEIFGIYDCEGEDNVTRRANALIPSPDPPRVIGMVLDADTPDLTRRWQSIRDKLARHGYAFPSQPNPSGTILEAFDLPRLGIWLMPNNQLTGMLENFCSAMISAKQLEVAEAAIALAKKEGVATFKDVHKAKALVHAHLAWQDEPGRPLGQAITAGTLMPETPLARAFTDWLKLLFA